MCQTSQRPPSVSPWSHPAMSAAESHTGREKVIPKTKCVMPCSHSPPWKWELYLGDGDGLAGKMPSCVSERPENMATQSCAAADKDLSYWAIWNTVIMLHKHTAPSTSIYVCICGEPILMGVYGRLRAKKQERTSVLKSALTGIL